MSYSKRPAGEESYRSKLAHLSSPRRYNFTDSSDDESGPKRTTFGSASSYEPNHFVIIDHSARADESTDFVLAPEVPAGMVSLARSSRTTGSTVTPGSRTLCDGCRRPNSLGIFSLGIGHGSGSGTIRPGQNSTIRLPASVSSIRFRWCEGCGAVIYESVASDEGGSRRRVERMIREGQDDAMQGVGAEDREVSGVGLVFTAGERRSRENGMASERREEVQKEDDELMDGIVEEERAMDHVYR